VGSPCRSISLGIARASTGDVVLVGPGYYSDDLDSDGVFGEPGEEPTSGIVIAKSITVESRYGASETYVAFRTRNIPIFNVASGGVTLGKTNKGFTVSALEGSAGVSIQGVDGVTVAGMQISTVHLPPPAATTVGIGVTGDPTDPSGAALRGRSSSPASRRGSAGVRRRAGPAPDRSPSTPLPAHRRARRRRPRG
jgi:hypothetical protein